MIFANTVLRTLLAANGPTPYTLLRPTVLRPPIITFSGTVSFGDVLDDIQIQKLKCSEGCYVHAGFGNRARRILSKPDVSKFLNTYDNVIFGGYSLGGAVAVIAAYLCALETQQRQRHLHVRSTCRGRSQLYATLRKVASKRTFRYGSRMICSEIKLPIQHVGKQLVLDYTGTSVVDNHQLTRYASTLTTSFDLDRNFMDE